MRVFRLLRSAVVTKLGDYIYACGGNYHDNGHRFHDAETCERYNVAANSWATIASMPAGRTNPHWHTPYFTFVGYRGAVYMTSGSYCDNRAHACGTSRTHSTTIKYDPETNAWTTASEGNSRWGVGTANNAAQYQYVVSTE